MPPHWLCALYPVPRDYADPSAGTVLLAVAKLPAADPAKRRGSVFFNPGGPGGPGLGNPWEHYVGPSVHQEYDLVTWDPRGVVFSEPGLDCLSPAASGSARGVPEAVLTDPEMQARLNATAAIARGCAQDRLTRFVTTMDNVRDLDRLRQAVGDRKLSFVGLSYGTAIGAVYANVFPGRYRALVLHGVVDSTSWFQSSFAFTTDDAVEKQKTLNAALRACDEEPTSCALAPHAPQKYAQLLARVRALALATGNSQQFTGLWGNSWGLIGGPTVSPDDAARVLQRCYQAIVVDHAMSCSEFTAEAHEPPPPETWAPANRFSDDVRDATICSDAGPMPDGWIAAAHQADRVAPVFGAATVLDRSMCASWSAFGGRYTGGWDHGRAPILLLNYQWDQATPLASAQTMTRRLGHTHLVTISGWGHTGETPCSTRAVAGYLLTGRLPSTSFCGDGSSLFAPAPEVFAGVADSVRTGGSHPSPWRGSQNIVFRGCNYFTPSRCPERGARPVYDAGALRLANRTAQAMTVSNASVTIGSCTFRPWPGLRVTVPAHKQLILTQTGGMPPCPGGAVEGENFDTSDTNTTSNKCKNDGKIPVFHVTVDGHALTYRDTHQILNTGGKDRGAKACGSHNETRAWAPITPVP